MKFDKRARIYAVAIATLVAAGCGDSPDKLLADARQQRDKGQHNAAIIQLKNLLGKAPEHAEVRYLLGITYLDTGDVLSAEKELRRAHELRYDPAKTLPPLGKALLAMREHKKLLEEIPADTAGPAPLQADVLALRGHALLALGNKKDAQAAYERALALAPEHAEALLGQARMAAADRRLDETAKLVERALARSPTNTDALQMKGDLNRDSNRDAALAAYRKVIEQQPENVGARANLALAHISGKEFDEAAKVIGEIRRIAPKSPLAGYLQALIEFQKGNHRGAREALEPMLKAAPGHLPSLLLSGSIEYALGAHAQAQQALATALERVPSSLYARRLLAASLARTGQAQRARDVLEPALKQAPEDGALLALAGEVAIQNNDYAGATRFFARAAEVDPKSPGARTGLAVARLASGDTETGMADLGAAVELDSAGNRADVLLILSHLRQGKFDQALKAAEALEKKQPKNPLTYNLKATVYLGKKDPASARKSLERALELQPNYVSAATNLALLDLQDKNPKAARQRLESILEREKSNADALMALANLGPALGVEPKQRIDWLEQARRANPESPRAAIVLARLHLQQGDAKKALEVAQQAQAAHSDNAEVLDTLGGIQLAAGEKNQALSTFAKLVAVQPGSPVALLRLAGAQAANGQTTDATASLKKALALKRDYADAQIGLAQLAVGAGRHAEAITIAQQVQKQQPKSPLGATLEGDVLMAEKKFAQAARAYETAFAIGKSGPLAVKLHTAYSLAGKPAEGEARIAQWLSQAPEDVAVRLYVAENGLRTGDTRKSIEQYEWLQKRQPDNPVFLNNLAWAYHQTKDARALATAERAYQLKPDNAAIADTLGWILVEQGSMQRGLEILRKALAAAPKAPEIRFHVAVALDKSGDRAGAVKELETLLSAGQRFPQEAEAQALLKKLRN